LAFLIYTKRWYTNTHTHTRWLFLLFQGHLSMSCPASCSSSNHLARHLILPHLMLSFCMPQDPGQPTESGDESSHRKSSYECKSLSVCPYFSISTPFFFFFFWPSRLELDELEKLVGWLGRRVQKWTLRQFVAITCVIPPRYSSFDWTTG